MDVAAHPPGVMVSSTFYDLRQIREDIRRFLEDELGYRPLYLSIRRSRKILMRMQLAIVRNASCATLTSWYL